MSTIDLEQQIACIKRELGFRARCYPQWVAGKRMSQAKADHEIAAMKAVLVTLERCAAALEQWEPASPEQVAVLAGKPKR